MKSQSPISPNLNEVPYVHIDTVAEVVGHALDVVRIWIGTRARIASDKRVVAAVSEGHDNRSGVALRWVGGHILRSLTTQSEKMKANPRMQERVPDAKRNRCALVARAALTVGRDARIRERRDGNVEEILRVADKLLVNDADRLLHCRVVGKRKDDT